MRESRLVRFDAGPAEAVGRMRKTVLLVLGCILGSPSLCDTKPEEIGKHLLEGVIPKGKGAWRPSTAVTEANEQTAIHTRAMLDCAINALCDAGGKKLARSSRMSVIIGGLAFEISCAPFVNAAVDYLVASADPVPDEEKLIAAGLKKGATKTLSRLEKLLINHGARVSQVTAKEGAKKVTKGVLDYLPLGTIVACGYQIPKSFTFLVQNAYQAGQDVSDALTPLLSSSLGCSISSREAVERASESTWDSDSTRLRKCEEYCRKVSWNYLFGHCRRSVRNSCQWRSACLNYCKIEFTGALGGTRYDYLNCDEEVPRLDTSRKKAIHEEVKARLIRHLECAIGSQNHAMGGASQPGYRFSLRYRGGYEEDARILMDRWYRAMKAKAPGIGAPQCRMRVERLEELEKIFSAADLDENVIETARKLIPTENPIVWTAARITNEAGWNAPRWLDVLS